MVDLWLFICCRFYYPYGRGLRSNCQALVIEFCTSSSVAISGFGGYYYSARSSMAGHIWGSIIGSWPCIVWFSQAILQGMTSSNKYGFSISDSSHIINTPLYIQLLLSVLSSSPFLCGSFSMGSSSEKCQNIHILALNLNLLIS